MNTKKTKRQELIAKMQAILADTKDNTMTEEQQGEFNKCKSQIDLMDVSGSDDNGVLPRKVPMSIDGIEDMKETNKYGWMDTQGRSVKVYGHNDRAGSGQYNVGRFVRGMLTSNWNGAEAERELFSMTSTNMGAAGYTIPDVLQSELIDLSRANSVLSAAGAKTVNLEAGNNKMVRVISDPTVEIKPELEAFTGSNPTFDLVTFQPYTIGIWIQASQELVSDGQNFSQILQQVMSQSIGTKLDYLGLYGSGNAQPTGLVNLDGINTSPVATFNYDEILDGINECNKDNCSVTSYILSPTTNTTLAKLKESTTNAYLAMPDDVRKLNKYVTTSMSNDDLLVGDFSNLYLGLRQGITFDTSPVADDSFKKYAVSFRIVMRADWQAVRPNHFCLCSTNVS